MNASLIDRGQRFIQQLPVSQVENLKLGLFVFSALVLLGTLLGLAKKIVVFRDLGDLALCFVLIGTPVPFGIILKALSVQDRLAVSILFAIFELALLLVVLTKSIKDNGSLFVGLLAFLTKIPLSILFIVCLTGFLRKGRGSFRSGSGVFGILILGPLLYVLTHNNPPRRARENYAVQDEPRKAA